MSGQNRRCLILQYSNIPTTPALSLRLEGHSIFVPSLPFYVARGPRGKQGAYEKEVEEWQEKSKEA